MSFNPNEYDGIVITDDPNEWSLDRNPAFNKKCSSVFYHSYDGIPRFAQGIVWISEDEVFFIGGAVCGNKQHESGVILPYAPIKLKTFIINVERYAHMYLLIKSRRELDEALEYYGNY